MSATCLSLPLPGQDEEGGLEGVLGVLLVPQHAPAQAQHHRPVAAHQCREGLLVPGRDEAGQEVAIAAAGDARRGQRLAQVFEDFPQAAGRHVRSLAPHLLVGQRKPARRSFRELFRALPCPRAGCGPAGRPDRLPAAAGAVRLGRRRAAMTESEWLEADNPEEMLKVLPKRRKGAERKLRLFACACCRRVWHLLNDERSRRSVEVAERYADGEADLEELRAVNEQAAEARVHGVATGWQAWNASTVPSPGPVSESLGACLGFWAAHWASFTDPGGIAGPDRAERAAQADLLRDIAGNPFRRRRRPLRGFLSWNGGTIPRLARAAYDERSLPSGKLDGTRLAILADALEEAGCPDADLVAHLRAGGTHVRGCVAVDLLRPDCR
jgi:hypothetical protein